MSKTKTEIDIDNCIGSRTLSIDWSCCGSEVRERINEKMEIKTGHNPRDILNGDAIMLDVFSEVLKEVYKELNYRGI